MAQITHLPAPPGVRPVSARIYIYGAGKNGTQKLPKRDKTGCASATAVLYCRTHRAREFGEFGLVP